MLPVIKRRLHRQIYFTIVICLVLVVAAIRPVLRSGRSRSIR